MSKSSTGSFTLPKYIYHATMIDAIPSIAANGIKSGSEIDRTSHSEFPCVPGSVYLSSHAPFYCFQGLHGWLEANDPDETLYTDEKDYPPTVILEIDTEKCPGPFHGDEDALEQFDREKTGYKMPPKGSHSKAFMKRHLRFVEQAKKCDPNDLKISFKWTGTVAHKGTIPWDAVTQVRMVDSESLCANRAFSSSGFYQTGPEVFRQNAKIQSAMTSRWFGREYDSKLMMRQEIIFVPGGFKKGGIVPIDEAIYFKMSKDELIEKAKTHIKAIESKMLLKGNAS